VDYELTNEDALQKGSTLSGSTSLMDHHPVDEANSNKTKKTNIGKNKKGNPKNWK
jgi:hypothetical protein